MLFIHPMWDNESQRIGMQKCTSFGYSLHGYGELIGFLGLLALVVTVGYMVFLAVIGSFGSSSWWLLSIPFGMGIISEVMVQISWMIAKTCGFEYDYEKREASWIEDGKRTYYKYAQQGNAEGRPEGRTLGIHKMNERHLEAMASMASQALHQVFCEKGTKEQYLLPEELFNDLLSTLRWLVLYSDDPLKDRLLDLYVYCIQESGRVDDNNFYGSPEWVNIRTAVRNFLAHLTKFDFDAWEQRALKDA